ncbi:hypothetical protein B0H15DRAFT_810485 [Mycena belliarum]|uniref:Uncharacterized protein n=1 Tax=Mycena belliarum TaxID=1033014 RepID=A0AAD6Y2J6_9AGAR|nr:hypothetical protein B0H15DRAFT_810485 [Mycena belliae]
MSALDSGRIETVVSLSLPFSGFSGFAGPHLFSRYLHLLPCGITYIYLPTSTSHFLALYILFNSTSFAPSAPYPFVPTPYCPSLTACFIFRTSLVRLHALVYPLPFITLVPMPSIPISFRCHPNLFIGLFSFNLSLSHPCWANTLAQSLKATAAR